MPLTHNDLNKLQEILAKMDETDFTVVNQIVRDGFSNVQLKARVAFRIGDIVEWDAKIGKIVTGKITKINRKTIIVRAADTGTEWRVSPSLLKKAA